MLPFAISQASALSQAKKNLNKSPASDQQSAAHRSRKGLLTRGFKALFEARRRRAEIEIEHHRRFYEGQSK
jgi:hypothetical protein